MLYIQVPVELNFFFKNVVSRIIDEWKDHRSRAFSRATTTKGCYTTALGVQNIENVT